MVDRTLTELTADEILDGLNEALLAEHQAVADYDAHAQAIDQIELREALELLRDVEQEHALRLASRIKALGGTPISPQVDPQPAGDTVRSWLAQDLGGEQWAIVEYARLIAGAVDDDETSELMAELLWDEIRHARWLKSTLRALEGEVGFSD
jgi:bacterioferritin (cytochrome b1)